MNRFSGAFIGGAFIGGAFIARVFISPAWRGGAGSALRYSRV